MRRDRVLARWLAVFACLASLLASNPAGAATVQVAVATNFAAPAQRIATEFARDTGHDALVVTGATGTLYAQIRNGAPFEVLLAADAATPRKLEGEGAAVPGSAFTYAMGRLILWSTRPDFVDVAGEVLRRGTFQHVAIANPKLAPYGAAAIETLGALGLLDALRPKFLTGESVAQAAQFVATGNAELGFVALSQVQEPGRVVVGSYWLVPARLHSPIRQDAVLLERGASNPAARAFCEYLKGAKARDLVRAYGYALP